jgi:V/A-type H+-transporting ATPase subunit D
LRNVRDDLLSQLSVPPTRTNLLRFKRGLQQAQSGSDILEKKRDILMIEFRNFIFDTNRTRQELAGALKQALNSLAKANAYVGMENVEKLVQFTSASAGFSIDYRGIMGVPVPLVKAESVESQPDYGFLGTNIYLDVAFKKFHGLLDKMFKLAELQESVYRIADSVATTQRRVNALKQIHIPRYQKTVEGIQMVLEEQEREEFVRTKKVKSVIEKRRSSRG